MTSRRSPTADKIHQAAALLTLAATAKPPPGPCLDDEQLALLLDDRSGSKPEILLAHLAHCPECYQRWRLAGSERPARPSFWKKSRPIGALLAAAACVALYFQVIKLGESPIAPLPISGPTLSLEKAEQSSEISAPQSQKPATSEAVPASPPARVAVDKEKIDPAEPPRGKGQAVVPRDVAPVPAPAAKSVEPPPPAPSAIKEQKALGEGMAIPKEPPPQERMAAAPAIADQAIAPAPAARAAAKLAVSQFAAWRRELAEACRRESGDFSRWGELARRGQGLQPGRAVLGDQEKAAVATLLALLQGIDRPEAVAPTCRLILAELAKTGVDK